MGCPQADDSESCPCLISFLRFCRAHTARAGAVGVGVGIGIGALAAAKIVAQRSKAELHDVTYAAPHEAGLPDVKV